MNSEREIIRKLLENNVISTTPAILPEDDDTIIRAEVHPVSTADRPNIMEDTTTEIEVVAEDPVYLAAIPVMETYQNANRWLDSIKESLLVDLNLPYFSKIVHNLAHSMPVRFDSFGDILHTINLKVPYPSTVEYSSNVESVEGYIESIFNILDSIKQTLISFKKTVESTDFTSPLSLLCDPLLTDIQGEYEYFIRAKAQLGYYGSNLAHWDKKVYEMYNAKAEGNIE